MQFTDQANMGTKLQPQTIGFDFDGVIADIGEAFIRMACTEHGYCSIKLEDISSFHVEECIDIPLNIVETIFNDILEDSLATGLKPMPGAIATLQRLTEITRISIITARPKLEPVINWIDHFLAPEACANLDVIATGDHDNKEHFIRRCGLRHFVDDRALTCLQLAAVGLNPIVFTQPWNQAQHQLPSVANWHEIAELIDFSQNPVPMSQDPDTL